MKVNRERLASLFITLCETDSPSRKEGKMADKVKELFGKLSPDSWFEDNSAIVTGSECGNLFFRFPGSLDSEPIFLNCHLDTVEPGIGVKVNRKNNIFTSRGETILGSDDKAGIAALIEAMRVIRETGLSCRPVEFILTVCEEIGLLGAKALDPDNIQADFGYALDSTGFGRVIIAAPACNRVRITVKGAAAHAGFHPEKGINAITLAAQALSKVKCGRIDEETTVNFGVITGGVASNIVPEEVRIDGEIRSHSQKKLEEMSRDITSIFTTTLAAWQSENNEAGKRPEVKINIKPDFPLMKLDMEDKVISEVQKAAAAVDIPLEFGIAGGGSDANILASYGLKTAIIATGMTNVHSTNEQVSLDDMEQLTRLIISLLVAGKS